MTYLASSSPRRAELLRQIGIEFKVHASDVDESVRPDEMPEDYVCRLAENKARQAARELAALDENYRVLAADTTIAVDDDIIGKPADAQQCRCILEQLSARQHMVLTAVALATPAGVALRLSRNRVRFKRLSRDEIEAYCDSAEPMDKAGAYAIQGRAAIFVEHLEGSYSGVMGLPLFETAELLQQAAIELL